MPNGFKYNTNSEYLALKKGNFYIATGDVGKGPTSTSGFYNGITPPAGGYTIYINKASNGPSIYVASNDSALISLTSKISGTLSNNTVPKCLLYFAGQTDKIVLSQDIDFSSTKDLYLKLDSSSTISYPRIDTTWYDLSPNAYDSTLVNGVTFNSLGWLTFDGVDDYSVGSGSLGQNCTVELWISSSNYASKIPISIDSDGYGSGPNLYFECGYINWNTGDSCDNAFSNSYYPDSNWHHIVVVNNRTESIAELFIDGVSIGTAGAKTSTTTLGANKFWVGRFHGGGYNINANIKSAAIYNRVLTTSEVIQNYYGGNTVTDGLVLFLDGANIVSYPETSTVWYDLTSNDYSVTGSNLQLGKNSRYSLFSDGNNPEIASSDILDNDYHTIEMVLMFKSSVDYPNGYTGSWEQFFGYYGGGSDRTPGVWRFPSERRIHWRYDPGNTGVDFGKNLAGDQFDLNTYYHVTVTKNGGIAEAWVNGVFVNSNGVASPKTSGSSVVRFFDYYTSGLMEIQVCKIYNRVLTNQEIYQNYNSLANRL